MGFIENPGEALKELAASTENIKIEKVNLESEVSLIKKALQDKDAEKQRILDLYRRKIIGLSDTELQLEKIASEKGILEQKLKELKRRIQTELNKEIRNKNIEELLFNLRKKIERAHNIRSKERNNQDSCQRNRR